MPMQLLITGPIYIIDAHKGVLSTKMLSPTVLQSCKNIHRHIDIHGAHRTGTVDWFTRKHPGTRSLRETAAESCIGFTTGFSIPTPKVIGSAIVSLVDRLVICFHHGTRCRWMTEIRLCMCLGGMRSGDGERQYTQCFSQTYLLLALMSVADCDEDIWMANRQALSTAAILRRSVPGSGFMHRLARHAALHDGRR